MTEEEAKKRWCPSNDSQNKLWFNSVEDPVLKTVPNKKIQFTKSHIGIETLKLSHQISTDYQKKNLFLIGVLNGALFFTSDLIKNLEIPYEVSFIKVQSYGNDTKSSGNVHIVDLNESIEGKDIIIVEDIVDTGTTLFALLDVFKKRGPKSIKVCTLVNNLHRRRKDIDLVIHYNAFQIIEEKFLVGYGMDCRGKGRTFKDIYMVEE